jgi:hypothetical protein
LYAVTGSFTFVQTSDWIVIETRVMAESVPVGMEELMIFIVTGERENGPVSATCKTAVAALQQARRLADEGARDVLIDADGQEYVPADFNRLFLEPDTIR